MLDNIDHITYANVLAIKTIYEIYKDQNLTNNLQENF